MKNICGLIIIDVKNEWLIVGIRGVEKVYYLVHNLASKIINSLNDIFNDNMKFMA